LTEIKIKGLTKEFGKTVAVENLSLIIKDREFVVFLGPSGCGKTTTLRCISGLERQTEGDIYIGGALVNDLLPRERDIAMVFQSYALYPHMRIYDNIAFPLKIKKVPKQETNKRVKEVASLLKIKELLNRKPKELSGGQQQRVALGRAIIREPKVFLMDEPLSNLDAKLRIYMRVELKKLQEDLKITTVYVTHDQVEAMTLADRIAFLNEGKLLQYSTPDEIYSQPEDQFIAGFMGNPPTNFIECSLIEKDSALYLDNGDELKFKLDSPIAKLIEKNARRSELVLGIRPEDILIHLNRVKDAYAAKLYAVEDLGRESIINLSFGDDLLKIRSSKQLGSVKMEDRVWFTFDESKMHIFEKGGKTIF
jgi:multiple sugar transport system ATP-binding protein